MSILNVRLPHRLTQDDATQRMKNLFGEVKNEYSAMIGEIEESWEGHSGQVRFSAMGMPISGGMIVTPSEVDITIDLPMAVLMFRGMIETTLRERAQKLLG